MRGGGRVVGGGGGRAAAKGGGGGGGRRGGRRGGGGGRGGPGGGGGGGGGEAEAPRRLVRDDVALHEHLDGALDLLTLERPTAAGGETRARGAPGVRESGGARANGCSSVPKPESGARACIPGVVRHTTTHLPKCLFPRNASASLGARSCRSCPARTLAASPFIRGFARRHSTMALSRNITSASDGAAPGSPP